MMSTPPRNPHFGDSLRHAWDGVRYVIGSQRNFRVHLVAAILVGAAGWTVRLTRGEWLVLTLIVGQVLLAEMVNTVAETMVDLISPTYHPLAKRAKDVAAGAVLLAASIAVVMGVLLFGPSLLAFLKSCL